jgi:hypothetical protein
MATIAANKSLTLGHDITLKPGMPLPAVPKHLRVTVTGNSTCIPLVSASVEVDDEILNMSAFGQTRATWRHARYTETRKALSDQWPVKGIKSDHDSLRKRFAEAMTDVLQGYSALIGIQVDQDTGEVDAVTQRIEESGDHGSDGPYLVIQEGLPAIIDSPDIMSDEDFTNLPSYHSGISKKGSGSTDHFFG